MATGYTADLPKTFPEFAMRCARAFGALVEMHEMPLDAPIPESFKADNYHDKRLKEANDRLAVVINWTDRRAEQEALKSYEKALKAWELNGQKNAALRRKYDDMIADVKSWTPPTTDHVALKVFMIQQLEESRKFDCEGYDKPKQMTARAYKMQEVRSLTHDVEYHTEHQGEEQARAEKRTKWVRDLRESLAKWTT